MRRKNRTEAKLAQLSASAPLANAERPQTIAEKLSLRFGVVWVQQQGERFQVVAFAKSQSPRFQNCRDLPSALRLFDLIR